MQKLWRRKRRRLESDALGGIRWRERWESQRGSVRHAFTLLVARELVNVYSRFIISLLLFRYRAELKSCFLPGFAADIIRAEFPKLAVKMHVRIAVLDWRSRAMEMIDRRTKHPT